MASTSRALADQAQQLQQTISFFNIDGTDKLTQSKRTHDSDPEELRLENLYLKKELRPKLTQKVQPRALEDKSELKEGVKLNMSEMLDDNEFERF